MDSAGLLWDYLDLTGFIWILLGSPESERLMTRPQRFHEGIGFCINKSI